MPIAVSAHKKSPPSTTVQFYVQENLKLDEQIVELQELKDLYSHLRNLRNQTYNLNEVPVMDKMVTKFINFLNSVNWKIDSAVSGPLPTKQAATHAATATSNADDKLANQRRTWDIESFNSNYKSYQKTKDKTLSQEKPLTRMLAPDTLGKLINLNWMKPDTNYDGVGHIIL